MQVFINGTIPKPTRDQKKVSRIAIRISKAARERHKNGPVTIAVYDKSAARPSF